MQNENVRAIISNDGQWSLSMIPISRWILQVEYAPRIIPRRLLICRVAKFCSNPAPSSDYGTLRYVGDCINIQSSSVIYLSFIKLLACGNDTAAPKLRIIL